MRLALFVFVFYLMGFSGMAQNSPANNAVLHYAHVHFQSAPINGAKIYALSLGLDSGLSKMVKPNMATNTLAPFFDVSNLTWGKHYYWQIDALDSLGKSLNKTPVYHFQLMKIRNRYFDEVKLAVKKNSNVVGFSYLAIDYARTIFNVNGEAVWTLPNIPGLVDNATQIRDFKITSDQTITFLANNIPVEVDFYGNVLWQGPKPFVVGKDTVVFHHEFRKDKLGNYWVLGNKLVYRKLIKPVPLDMKKNEANLIQTDSGTYKLCEVAMLCKFDRSKQLTWIWDANHYLKDVDLNHKMAANGMPLFHSHANAFSLSDDGKKAFIGFRDLNRIIRLDIAKKKVDLAYGEFFPSGQVKHLPNAFMAQHDAGVTPRGTILILNNNGARGGGPSSVIEFREVTAKMPSVVVWKFGLNFDSLSRGKSLKGGNVLELLNGDVFVCAGELNRLFVVTKEKQVVWDAFIYSRSNGDTTWQDFAQYRAFPLKELVMPHFMAFNSFNIENSSNSSITIINTGQIDDKYQIKVYDLHKKLLWENVTDILSPSSTTIVNPTISHDFVGEFEVQINSLRAPAVRMTLVTPEQSK